MHVYGRFEATERQCPYMQISVCLIPSIYIHICIIYIHIYIYIYTHMYDLYISVIHWLERQSSANVHTCKPVSTSYHPHTLIYLFYIYIYTYICIYTHVWFVYIYNTLDRKAIKRQRPHVRLLVCLIPSIYILTFI